MVTVQALDWTRGTELMAHFGQNGHQLRPPGPIQSTEKKRERMP